MTPPFPLTWIMHRALFYWNDSQKSKWMKTNIAAIFFKKRARQQGRKDEEGGGGIGRRGGGRRWVKERERDAPVPGWQTQGPTRAGRWKGGRRRRREGGKRRGVWWGQSTPPPWNSLPSLPPPPSRKSMLALLVFLASLAKALRRTEQTSGLLVRALASRVWYWSGLFLTPHHHHHHHWPDRTDRTPGHLKNLHQGPDRMEPPSSHPSPLHSYRYKPSKQVIVTHLGKVWLIFRIIFCHFSSKYQPFVDNYDQIMLIKAALIKKKNVWGKKLQKKIKIPNLCFCVKEDPQAALRKMQINEQKPTFAPRLYCSSPQQTAWSMYAQSGSLG